MIRILRSVVENDTRSSIFQRLLTCAIRSSDMLLARSGAGSGRARSSGWSCSTCRAWLTSLLLCLRASADAPLEKPIDSNML